MRCSACESDAVVWVTGLRETPVDALRCGSCGHIERVEDWVAPLGTLGPDVCSNCTGLRHNGTCTDCGLTEAEDVEVHRELADMVGGQAAHQAALAAARLGRKLLGLKLATRAAAEGDEGARALRVWLLAGVGHPAAAMEDARAWSASGSALALASLAARLEAEGRHAEALGRWQEAVERDPDVAGGRLGVVRATLALGQTGEAAQRMSAAWSSLSEGQRALGLPLAGSIAGRLLGKDDAALSSLLDALGDDVERDAELLAARAELGALAEDVPSVQRDLTYLRRLSPRHNALYGLRG